MKLAFCLFKYFPFGGLQRDFLRIAQECVHRGHTVDVYTLHWEGPKPSTLSITIVPVRGWQNHTRARYFAEKVEHYVAAKGYDLVVGFNKMPGLDVYYAADTCFQAKAREKHGSWYRCLPRYRQLVAAETAVFAAEKSTEILLLSISQQSEFIQYYATLKTRFHLLPPGISRDRCAPPNAADIREKVRKAWNIAPTDFLVLMVGSGFKTKGLDRILKGLASLPENLREITHLFVLGQDHAASFQQQAKKLGIVRQVKFLGGRSDVTDFLLGADLLLHPAYNESAGAVLLEALVAGLPVLTTAVCGYAFYVEQAHAGLVLPSPFSQVVFNEALAHMLLSNERARWRQNALAFAQNADIYSLPVRAVDIIESVGRKRATSSTS